jgi:hypothetical protein
MTMPAGTIPAFENMIRTAPQYAALRDSFATDCVPLDQFRVADCLEDGRGYEMIYVATPDLRAYRYELDESGISREEILRESDPDDWAYALAFFLSEKRENDE